MSGGVGEIALESIVGHISFYAWILQFYYSSDFTFPFINNKVVLSMYLFIKPVVM